MRCIDSVRCPVTFAGNLAVPYNHEAVYIIYKLFKEFNQIGNNVGINANLLGIIGSVKH